VREGEDGAKDDNGLKTDGPKDPFQEVSLAVGDGNGQFGLGLGN
jgi:hypothetical protein